MKILIAPDKYKEALTASGVAHAIEDGFRRVFTDLEAIHLPIADGGDGTVESLVEATDGSIVKLMVRDPLSRSVEAYYGLSGDGKTAFVEMATASGIRLMDPSERNPEKTTTFGTGQLLKDALDKGVENIIFGIGGSATNDCGMGMAIALGAKFYDENNNELEGIGSDLIKVAKIDLTGMDTRLKDVKITAACDVDNPLYGITGSAYTYGWQKGADDAMIVRLDDGLKNIAKVIASTMEKSVHDLPGSGAAGGLGAAVVAFLDGELESGIEIITKYLDVESKLEGVDLVITGEGKMDWQTAHGKAPVGISLIAKEKGIPTIAICGALGQDANAVYDKGINCIFSTLTDIMTIEEALCSTKEAVTNKSENIARLIKLAKEL